MHRCSEDLWTAPDIRLNELWYGKKAALIFVVYLDHHSQSARNR
jgi:hypothetical protein